MEDTQKKPCKQCPFRKESHPGWLGGFTVEETMAAAVSEGDFHCHMTRSGNDDGHVGKPLQCAGRMLYATKIAKNFRMEHLDEIRRKVTLANPGFRDHILGFDLGSHHRQTFLSDKK